jgi:hypothetical protein
MIKNEILWFLFKVTNHVTKVPKIPVDQIISGAVKQYIDYVKTDNKDQIDEQLLPLLNDTSEQDSSSGGDKYKTNETITINGILWKILKINFDFSFRRWK